MTHQIYIRYGAWQQPWWTNFMMFLRNKHAADGTCFNVDQWMEFINNELRQYNGRCKFRVLTFDTERDALVFILRWS